MMRVAFEQTAEDGSALAFLLPFLVIGSLHFVSALTTFLVLWKEKEEKANTDGGAAEERRGKQMRFLLLIKIPAVLYFQLIVVMANSNFGFLNGNTPLF